MLPITRMISAYNHYDYNAPKYIVLHYTGNSKDTAYNNAKYFNGGNRNASAHYFVDDNSIYQVVEDNNGAWHVGNTKTEVNNKNSIGIEMCTSGNYEISAKTEANAIELVKYLMNKYNIPLANVRTHAEVTKYGKTCPNWSANNWQRWNNFKSKLVSQQPSQTQPTQPSTPTNSDFKVGNYNNYVVTIDDLNVRQKRNGGSTLLTTIPKGTKVYVGYVMYQDNSATPNGDLWGGVTYNGKTGFINLRYAKPYVETSNSTVVNYRVRITANSLNVRKEPNATSIITTTVSKGGVFTIVEVKDGWGKLKSGAGWINLSYTEKL